MRTKAKNNGAHLIYARRGVSAATLCAFKDNLFRIAVDAEGYQQWKQEVVANGEKAIHLQPLLERKAEK